MKELEHIVNNLKSSPVYAMSLGSKELFHTNFWAWIMEHEKYQKEFINLFFADIIIDNISKITREEGNRDITIWVDNNSKAYVIENKLKSIATKEQLDNYKKRLDKKFAGGVVTGIEDPKSECSHWKFISYEKIAEKLMKIAPNCDTIMPTRLLP